MKTTTHTPTRLPGGISETLFEGFMHDEPGPEPEDMGTISCTFSRRNLNEHEANMFAGMLRAHLETLYTGRTIEIATTDTVAWSATLDGEHSDEVLKRAAALYLHPFVGDVLSRIGGLYAGHLVQRVLAEMAAKRNAHPAFVRAFAAKTHTA